MSEYLVANLPQVRRAFDIAYAQLERTVGTELHITSDYFWTTSPDERYNFAVKPEDQSMGQISEVIEHLAALDIEPERVTSHHLLWVAELLRAIADHSPPF